MKTDKREESVEEIMTKTATQNAKEMKMKISFVLYIISVAFNLIL